VVKVSLKKVMKPAFRDLPRGAMPWVPYVDNEWFPTVKAVGWL
jgi:hypothetical protein